jgi:hypothetical protein
MNKFIKVALLVVLVVLTIFSFTQVSEISSYGVTKMDEIFDSQNDYITDSAPQATQLNTQLTMEMTREIGKSIAIGLNVIILILLFVAAAAVYIIFRLSKEDKAEEPIYLGSNVPESTVNVD